MKYEIKARLEKSVEDGIVVIRINWLTDAANIIEAISKAKAYIRIAESDEQASCTRMLVGEEEDV